MNTATEDGLINKNDPDLQWYEDEIEVRGAVLSLPKIKAAYRELAVLTKQEGDKLVGSLVKPDEESDEDFAKRCAFLKDDAFRITVSIIGFDGETAYRETEEIFDSKNLPFPIKTIFFTNRNSFRRHAEGNEPRNRFLVWVHFDKPPLFDPISILSAPTPNGSRVEIHADNVTYMRTVQKIVADRLQSNRKWYSFIHERFAYDIGLWFVAMPYALYWVTIYADYFLPSDGQNSSFRVAFFIYGMGLSLVLYRALSGYLKWAFPVNTLEENKDRATAHRVVIGGILLGAIGTGVRSLVAKLNGF